MTRILKSKAKTDKIVFLGDTHFPYQDPIAVSLALSFVRWYQPDYVYLIGDIVDFYSLSRYEKDPDRANNLQWEIDQTVEFLNRLRAATPHSKIYYKEGNHEERLLKYLRKNPEMHSLRALSLSSLLSLEKFRIQHVGYRELLLHQDNFLVEHGDIVRKHSSYTASGMLEKRQMSGISGHTHRMGVHHRTNMEGIHSWAENGCLCKINPEYFNGVPNWQQGFSVGTYIHKTGKMMIHQIPVFDQTVFYNDVFFEADGKRMTMFDHWRGNYEKDWVTEAEVRDDT